MLVAVATSEDKTVTQHFGRADLFQIYRLSGERVERVETRRSASCSLAVEHHDEALQRKAESIADCAWVVAARAGPGAVTALGARGIKILMTYDLIEQALAYLQKLLAEEPNANVEVGA